MHSHDLLTCFQFQRETFVSLLTKLSGIPSHNGEAKEIDLFLDESEKLFGPHFPWVRRIPGQGGDILHMGMEPTAKDAVVLLAHVDTVRPSMKFPLPHVWSKKLFGRGVCDMKSAIALFYLVLQEWLSRKPSLPSGLQIILTPDEESGSPHSRDFLLESCQKARAVLLPEPSGPGGAVKTRRMAVGRITAELKGKAAHSGLAPLEGRDANRALVSLIESLDVKIRSHEGMTFNPGIVSGGVSVNMVSPRSRLEAEARSFSTEGLRACLDEISRTHDMSGVSVSWNNWVQHPALEKTTANDGLLSLARRIMAEVDYDFHECESGGASDGSSLSSAGVPVLDGIGMKGAHAHADGEYVEIDDFPPRAFLLTRLIEEMT